MCKNSVSTLVSFSVEILFSIVVHWKAMGQTIVNTLLINLLGLIKYLHILCILCKKVYCTRGVEFTVYFFKMCIVHVLYPWKYGIFPHSKYLSRLYALTHHALVICFYSWSTYPGYIFLIQQALILVICLYKPRTYLSFIFLHTKHLSWL